MAAQQTPSIRSTDVEKNPAKEDPSSHNEYTTLAGGMSQDDANFLETYPDAARKKAVRKVDVSCHL